METRDKVRKMLRFCCACTPKCKNCRALKIDFRKLTKKELFGFLALAQHMRGSDRERCYVAAWQEFMDKKPSNAELIGVAMLKIDDVSYWSPCHFSASALNMLHKRKLTAHELMKLCCVRILGSDYISWAKLQPRLRQLSYEDAVYFVTSADDGLKELKEKIAQELVRRKPSNANLIRLMRHCARNNFACAGNAIFWWAWSELKERQLATTELLEVIDILIDSNHHDTTIISAWRLLEKKMGYSWMMKYRHWREATLDKLGGKNRKEYARRRQLYPAENPTSSDY